MQAPRLAASAARMRCITRLTRLTKRARRLVTTGAILQGFWGVEACGIAPTQLKLYRTRIACTTGIQAHMRCATTASVCSYPFDPTVEVVRRALVTWIGLLPHLTALLPRLRVAWKTIFPQSL